MKRTFIIRNVILTILILVIITGVAYYFITTNNKKYDRIFPISYGIMSLCM